MLQDAIRDFPKQFAWKPVVENAEALSITKKFLVAGMGGSNHATDVFKACRPTVDVIVHRDYRLPELHDASRLVIACSYSGNTEETIDAYRQAREKGFPVAVITKGGALLELAKQDHMPYVQLPDTGIQPRSATGFMFVALLKLMGDDEDLIEVKKLSKLLKVNELKKVAKPLAKALKKYVPIVYASTQNGAVANNWKIKMNENVKIPCYADVFPELNHNEMNGFDVQKKTEKLSKKFAFVFLNDDDDHPRVQKRMEILQDILTAKKFLVINASLAGDSRIEKIFRSLVVADWVTLFLAKSYGVDPEPVNMVEEFKKRMA